MTSVRDPNLADGSLAVSVEDQFLRLLYFEQKRSERSKRPFLLMVADTTEADASERSCLFGRLIGVIQGAVRETDHLGWQRAGYTLGVIFTEMEPATAKDCAARIADRIRDACRRSLTAKEYQSLKFSFHLFPEEWGENGAGPPAPSPLSLASPHRRASKRGQLLLKRLLDIFVGATAIVVTSPLMAIIAILVKATSRGPVLFRQQRVGQYGQQFTFLKFRSMREASDPGIHRAYVERWIGGGSEQPTQVHKITNDERVTPLGRFLRRTSLDELPQLFNVLAGDMSLVGPRPPIPYEVDCYQAWHRRRLLEVKPGITGLWQVSARSRVGFDEMVRLDLQYARNWSLWLDLKILLKTPRAVLLGDGAY